MKTTNSSTPVIVGALAIASIVGAALFVATQSNPTSTSLALTASSQTATKETTSQTTETAVNTTPATTSSNANASATAANTSGYKDGTYSASGNYSVPRGNNSIQVSLTVKNGVVSSVKTSHNYNDRESGMYIDSFDSRIESAVVGKSLGDISLSRVGGASLTTYGFEDALSTIANQAKA